VHAHQHPVAGEADVALEPVGSVVECSPVRRQRVFGLDGGRATMSHNGRAAAHIDHCDMSIMALR
jgi:hypothetical protein